MPRNSGLSSLTTTSPIRLRPSDRSEARCRLVPPILDLVWVTFSCVMCPPRSARAGRGAGGGRRGTGAQHGRGRHVLDRQAAPGGDLFGAVQPLERRDRRVHDVDRVRGAQGPGQHVVNAGALKHGAHRATGDDAGTGAGGLEQHDASRGLALYGVRDRATDARDAEEVLLGRLDALGDRRGHLLGLPVSDTDHAVAVADHDQGGEAEPAATLDHLGHPVDGHDSLEICGALVRPAAAVITALPPLTAATSSTRSCHQSSLSLLIRGSDPPEPPAAAFAARSLLIRGSDPPEPPAAAFAARSLLIRGSDPPEPPAAAFAGRS